VDDPPSKTPPFKPTASDPAWLSAFYVEYGVSLRRFVFGIVHDRDVADDVVQAVFTKAVQAAGELRPDGVKTWLYKVAFHEAINRKRRAQVERKASHHLRENAAGENAERADALPVRKETIEQVREAVRKLPLSQQQVLRARIYDDKTYAQIAAELNAPLGTVLTHMRRAIEKLRQKLNRND
jgi:RNA polymerase sigma factor (sigma-70 family)